MYKKLLILCLSSVVMVSCTEKPQDEEIKYVKTFTISNDVSALDSTFHGIVHAEYEPDLSFRVAGAVVSRNVDIGQVVSKGQILGKIDPADFKLSASSANSQLAAAKSAYVTQQANLSRYKSLLAQNFVSQAQYDIQKAQFDNAKAQYEQAQNQFSNSENQVGYTTLVAPSAGVITSVNMNVGQVVAAGQLVATMAVSGAKEVVVELPETQINSYKIGMPATIQMWALNKTFSGKIRTINAASDNQTRTYSARITIDDADDTVKYGMAADVTLKPLNNTSGIDVPLNSVYSTNGKSYLWKLDQNNIAQLVSIQVINTDGEIAKVETNEVKSGDRIVAAGANFIHQGQKLKEY